MRFRRLEARVFGVLRGRRLELPPEAVLVFGSNESGKSTFRRALETILFGFDPANREEHPLAAWDGGASGDLHLEAVIERDDGVTLRIERELLSRARLSLAEGAAGSAGSRPSNAPLDCVGGLSRELFRAVYSLELEQLAALDGDIQEHVDELLLPQAASLPLRPVAELREALRKAHLALWRPDRRGNTRAGELAEKIKLQRRELGVAAARECALRGARAEQAQLGERVRALEAQRRELDRTHHEAPFLGRLHDWKRRSRALGPPVDLSGMGEFAFTDPVALASEIARLEASCHEPRARLGREPEALGAQESALLAAASEIELARQAAGEHRAEGQRRDAQRRHSVALRESAARDLTALLGRAATAGDLEAARRLPLEALRAAHADWSAARSAPIGSGLGPTPFRALVAAVASFANAALLLWLEPLLGTLARPLALAAGALGFAALLAAFLVSRRPRPAPPQLAGLLAGLDPAAGLVENPAAVLRMIERLERAQQTLGELRGSRPAKRKLAAAASSRAERLARLCASLGVSAEGDVEACVARLSEALRNSRARAQRVELDRQERLRARERLDALRPGLEQLTAQLERVEAVLRSVETGSSASAAFARVEARRQAAQSLREIEDELRRDPHFAALEHDARIAAERDPSDAEWQPAAITRREAERAACEQELSAAHTRLGEIASLLREDPGSRQARAADLERAAEEELEATRRERDRLALLEAIVTRAEHDFREQHQPDVLRRASAYLERVTRGRWRQRPFRRGTRRRALRLRRRARRRAACRRAAQPRHARSDLPVPAPRPARPSRRGRERLPIVLDDALLRMDAARRAAVFELLAEISRRRQVFLLTCQEWIAAEAERALKLERITLPG